MDMSPKKHDPRQDADEKNRKEPLELDLPMSPEDEAALRQEAERNYREWLTIIEERKTD